MKRIGTVAGLMLLFVLVACKKENGNLRTVAAQNGPQGGLLLQEKVIASNWQTLDQWQQEGNAFYAKHRLPVKASGGKLLLFARNVWGADAPAEEPMEDITLQFPFYFMPYTDQPGLKETWKYELDEEEVKIDLKVEGGNLQPRPVQVRSLYIPDSVWKDITASGDGELAYESLVHRLHIEP